MRPYGPSSAGFWVGADELLGLSSVFAGQGDRLRTEIPAFQDAATNVIQAFGLLGPSDEVYFEYMALARDTVAGLHDLRRALERTGEGLRATVLAYEGAELNSSLPGAGGR